MRMIYVDDKQAIKYRLVTTIYITLNVKIINVKIIIQCGVCLILSTSLSVFLSASVYIYAGVTNAEGNFVSRMLNQ